MSRLQPVPAVARSCAIAAPQRRLAGARSQDNALSIRAAFRKMTFPKITRSPMSIKSDRWIRKMATEHDMINPFSEKQIREGVISFGLSSYGYDLRVADEFKIFTNVNSTIVDPKHFDERS